MKHLSWRREDIRDDLERLPVIWRVILGFIFLITTLFVTSLTENFHLIHDSWTGFLVPVTFAVALFVTVRIIRLKISN